VQSWNVASGPQKAAAPEQEQIELLCGQQYNSNYQAAPVLQRLHIVSIRFDLKRRALFLGGC
jgi:hypothetical protein